MTRPRFQHGYRTRSAAEIEALDKLSRLRALSLDESLRLEHAINRQHAAELKARRVRRALSTPAANRCGKVFGDQPEAGA